MNKLFASAILLFAIFASTAQTPADFKGEKLSGKVIGTQLAVDYNTGQSTTTINTIANAFDGDLNSFFASYERSFTWVGLEFDQPYVITGIGYCAREGVGAQRMQLAVFQGANNADFSDALPIYMIKEPGVSGKMLYAATNCSKGFKYVRFVGPNNARCNVAELEFYGYAGEGDESHLYQPTNLPLVVVNTPGMEWFHENDKEYAMEGSQIYVIDNGKFDTDAPGQIRGRGNASWTFPKKPFRIKFDKKQKVLGGPAKAKKWTMINNYGDKTLMRNMIAFELSRRIGMAFTPACHPVDLIFNGEYEGTYQLCDQVEVNPDRVNITEMKAKDIEGEALTGGYLIEIDGYAHNEPAGEWFYSQGGHNIPVTIKSPDPGITEQFNYIRSYFTQLENSVYAANYGDELTGYRHYLDEDSFLRHFIVGELSGNTDTYWSVYMTLDRGSEKFFTGPCWDFDLGFDNDSRTYPINAANKTRFNCFYGSFAGGTGMSQFVNRIINGSYGSKDRLRYLWSDARVNRGFDADVLDQLIEGYREMLYASQDLNFKRWPIMNSYVHLNPVLWGSYDGEVDAVKSYLRNRITRLDKLIGRVEVEGVDDIDADNSIAYTDGSAIRIEGPSPYTVATVNGIVVASGTGSARIEVAPGIYIVKHGIVADKLIVR